MALSLSLARLSLALSPPLLQGSPAKKLPAGLAFPSKSFGLGGPPPQDLVKIRLGNVLTRDDYPPKAVAMFAAVAALCVQYEADFRPNMSIVVKALQPLLNARASNHGENAGS